MGQGEQAQAARLDGLGPPAQEIALAASGCQPVGQRPQEGRPRLAVASTIPAGRLATPDDIGNACLFLASPLASYAAGANLLMNGGGERPAFLAASNTD